MMDREHGAPQKMLCVTMESLMTEKHFLRDLDRLVDFSVVYENVASLYSNTGRRSVDPVVIVKMMLLSYLYGIDSERRLEQEVQVNIAYRWFLWINLDEPVPDHSTFLSFAAVNSTAQHCLRTFLSRLFASASRRDLLPANFFSPILPMSELTQETICTKLLLSQTSRAPISND